MLLVVIYFWKSFWECAQGSPVALRSYGSFDKSHREGNGMVMIAGVTGKVMGWS